MHITYLILTCLVLRCFSLPSSQVVSGCVFSMLFPLFIVSANQAQVVVHASDLPVRIFHPTIALSNAIFAKTLQKSSSKPQLATQQQPPQHQYANHLKRWTWWLSTFLSNCRSGGCTRKQISRTQRKQVLKWGSENRTNAAAIRSKTKVWHVMKFPKCRLGCF